MIIITGATGQLGRAVVERLLERLPATAIGVSVRDPQKAAELGKRGVRVRQGNFEDGASLKHAFEGASQVLIVSSNSAGENAVEQHRTAIEAARDAGARRILYTSHMGAGAASHFLPMRDHAATEALLQTSGVAFTSLRNGFYADNGLWLMGPAAQTGTLDAPADGPVSWTTHADLAEATAIILADEGRLDGITPPLTNTQALDLAGLAATASELTGRPIQRLLMTDEAYRASLTGRGLPAAQVELFMGLFVASRQGEFAAVDPALSTLLGRPPISMREVLAGRMSQEGHPAE